MRKKLLYLLFTIVLLSSLILPIFPTGLASAITAPTVTAPNATAVTADSGTIWGNITSTGGENPNVWIMWAQQYDRQPGSDPSRRDGDIYEYIAYWQHSVDLGIQPAGTVSLSIGNLSPDTVWWSVVAINSAGVALSGSSFITTVPVPIFSYIAADTYFSYSLDGPYAQSAQTFTAVGNYTLTAAAFKINGSVPCTVELKDVDVNHKPTGVALATGTLTNYDMPAGFYPVFYFSVPYPVIDGTEYALLIRNTATSYATLVGNKTSGLYADGQLWWTSNYGFPAWETALAKWGTDGDILFRLYDSTDAYRVSSVRTNPSNDADITETTAILRGTVNDWYLTIGDSGYTTSFEYGLTTSYGNTTSATVVENYNTAISKTISGLTPLTVYHYRVKTVGTIGGLTGYSSDTTFLTPDYSSEGITIITGGVDTAAQIANQRKSFYAQGRFWVFFTDTNDYLSYKSSTDGVTFNSASIAVGTFTVEDNNDAQFCVAFDGTYVHLVTGRRGYKIAYRMGEPQPNGTITWAADTQETVGTATAGILWTAPYITVDAYGYPWIYIGSCSFFGNLNLLVFRSSTKNGIWTETAGYPKDPFTTLGVTYWQRGIALPLSNGDMYFIAGRRTNSDPYVCIGYQNLKGFKYTASTDSFSAPVDITTTAMDSIGDVNTDPYALFTATAWGDYVYLAFTNYLNQLIFLEYNNQSNTWSSETVLATGLARRTAPAITVHDVDGKIFLFWIVGNSMYYKYRSNLGVWSSLSSPIVSENLMDNRANINTWEHSVEGKTAVIYRTSSNSQIAYRGGLMTLPGGSKTYDIKFTTLSTGFSVGTDTPANIAGTSATLQGHIVYDGNETCNVRFEWGLTSAYGSTTTWQTGKVTGDIVTQAIAGLTVGTTYHFRVVARHADLTTVNGADLGFATAAAIPTITTNAVVSKTPTGGWLQGTLTSLGDYSTVSVYFKYGLTTAYGTTTDLQSKSVIGSYNQFITDLAPSTLYHYIAVVAYGSGSLAYGSDGNFTTMAASSPTITTGTAASVTNAGATLQGTVTSLGSYTPVYAYFQWGLTNSFGTNTGEQTMTATGGVNQAIAGLLPNTTYYFRIALRYNTSYYIYGGDGNFTTTTSGLPTVSTQSAASVGVSSATLQGSLTGLGDYSTVYVSFEYGLSTSYGSATTEQTKTSITGFTQSLISLTPSSTYHYRARVRYAAASYVNGADVTFTTLSAAPSGGLTISGANIFRDYDEANDALVVIEYENTYPPYYPSEDSAKYFWIQLRDIAGITIMAQTVCPDWGHRPASIYLNADTATSIEDGLAYQVFIYGNFAPYPSDEYTLTSSDWVGNDMTFLGRWCLRVAHNMETYYDIEFTEQTSSKHEVLNEDGGAIFDKNIPGLSLKIPDYFSIAKGELALVSTDYEDSFSESHLLADKMGPDVVDSMTTLGVAFGGLSAQSTAQIVWWVLAIGLGLAIAGLTHSLAAGGIVGYGTLGVGTFAGAVDVTVVIVIAFLAFGYFLWVNLVQKS